MGTASSGAADVTLSVVVMSKSSVVAGNVCVLTCVEILKDSELISRSKIVVL